MLHVMYAAVDILTADSFQVVLLLTVHVAAPAASSVTLKHSAKGSTFILKPGTTDGLLLQQVDGHIIRLFIWLAVVREHPEEVH
jgi:hypothetical protein